jgi:imidazoleglycerol-phosphate dehydratase
MDEALARSVVDISGRGFLAYRCDLPPGWVGTFDDQLFEEYLRALALNARITLHVELVYGKNRHHALEAMTKSMAQALRTAVRIDPHAPDIPSTKGVLV